MKSASEKIICYKEEDIWINGWCNTDGVNYAGTKGWGICSESCKFLKLQYDKEQNPEEFKEVYSDSTQIIFFLCCFDFYIDFSYRYQQQRIMRQNLS